MPNDPQVITILGFYDRHDRSFYIFLYRLWQPGFPTVRHSAAKNQDAQHALPGALVVWQLPIEKSQQNGHEERARNGCLEQNLAPSDTLDRKNLRV